MRQTGEPTDTTISKGMPKRYAALKTLIKKTHTTHDWAKEKENDITIPDAIQPHA